MKRCPACGLDKPSSEYYRRRNSKGFATSYCKPCWKAKQRDARAAMTPEERSAANRRWRTPEYTRSRHLKYKYGLTPEQYDEMLAAQAGVCAICQEPPTKRLVVDHHHETGTVRGLLCNHCNSLLGYSRERSDVLERALGYLGVRP